MNTSLNRFIAASGLTNLADGIATLLWAWVASLLTRDPVLIACMALALRLPWFICAIPAGIITDRVDRKQLILSMDVIRAVAFGLAGFAVFMALPLRDAPTDGVSNLGLYLTLMISAMIIGTAEVFRDNAAQTVLPAIVEDKDLERSNGRLWSVELIGQMLIGPALGAFLITLYLPFPFLMNALAFVLAFALVFNLKGKFKADHIRSNWRDEFMQGFRFLKGASILRTFAWITGGWNLVTHMMMIALILHVQDNLDLNAQAYGIILAVSAVGGVIGGWLGEHVVRFLGPWRSAKWMLVASAISFLAIAYAPSAWGLALALSFFELFGVIWNTVSVSYRQRKIPGEILGRVNSLYRMVAWGMIPIGLILSGLIVDASKTRFAYETALKMPLFAAALGSAFIAAFGWWAINIALAKTEI